jgi:hypothetical protein
MNKIFFVYFNNLPPAINQLVAADKNIVMTKEGVRSYGGSVFPRLTLKIKHVSPAEDSDRSRKIANLLQYLKDGGQIIDFNSQG